MRTFLLALLVIMLAAPATAGAQEYCDEFGCYGFIPLAKYENTPLSSVYQSDVSGQLNFGTFVNNFFKIALSIGAILAVLRIAVGGFTYMTSDAAGTKGKAKEILGDAVIGLLLLLSIWIILYQINPCLLRLDILTNIDGGTACNPDTEAANAQFNPGPNSNSAF